MFLRPHLPSRSLFICLIWNLKKGSRVKIVRSYAPSVQDGYAMRRRLSEIRLFHSWAMSKALNKSRVFLFKRDLRERRSFMWPSCLVMTRSLKQSAQSSNRKFMLCLPHMKFWISSPILTSTISRETLFPTLMRSSVSPHSTLFLLKTTPLMDTSITLFAPFILSSSAILLKRFHGRKCATEERRPLSWSETLSSNLPSHMDSRISRMLLGPSRRVNRHIIM